MVRGNRRRWPAVIATCVALVLCFSFLSPMAATAAQEGAASPVAEPTTEPTVEATTEPSPTELPTEPPAATETSVATETPTATATLAATETPLPTVTPSPTAEFEAAALISAIFAQPIYSGSPGATVTGLSFTINMLGPTSGGTATLFLPPEITIPGVPTASPTGLALCFSPAAIGNQLQFTFSSSDAGPSSCTVTFDALISPTAIVGALLPIIGPVADSVTAPMTLFTNIQVMPPSTATSATFTPNQYDLPVPIGSSVDTTLVISIAPGTTTGSFSVPLAFPGLSFGAPSVVVGSGATCTLGPGGSGLVSGSFTNPTANPVVCTVTIPVTVTGPVIPGPGPVLFGSATANGLPVFPQPLATIFLVAALPTMTISLNTANPAPGDVVDVTVTLTDTDFLPSILPQSITATLPPGLLVVPGSASYVCSMLCAGTSALEAPFSVTGNASPVLFPLTTTLTFSATVDPGLAAGTSLVFSATGSARGNAVGPVTAGATVFGPLTATDTTITVAPGATATGDLSSLVSHGIPPYAFGVATNPTQGSLTVNPDGTYSFTADPGATGTDSFVYTVTDSEPLSLGAAATTQGTVNIEFLAVAPSPTPTEPVETPSATITPTVPGTTGTVVPDDPDPDPTKQPTEAPGDPDPTKESPITSLPSTGSGESGNPAFTTILPLGALVLLGLAVLTALLQRRRREG
jgi:hypothetical protein